MTKKYTHHTEELEKVSNVGHHILLKQACSLIGRDYNIITSFNSYREETYTIHCAFAIIVVCTLAFGTFYTAVDFVLYDFVKPSVSEAPYEIINSWKAAIPAFWAFVIYVIDMSILNGHTTSQSRDTDNKITLFYFLKIGIFKVIFSKPLIAFRTIDLFPMLTL